MRPRTASEEAVLGSPSRFGAPKSRPLGAKSLTKAPPLPDCPLDEAEITPDHPDFPGYGCPLPYPTATGTRKLPVHKALVLIGLLSLVLWGLFAGAIALFSS